MDPPAAAAAPPAAPVPVVPTPPALITKTRALQEFCLNPKDLSRLPPPLYTRNPRFRSAAPMQLYPLESIQRLAEEKFGGTGELHQEQETREKKRQARDLESQRKRVRLEWEEEKRVDARREVLKQALEARQLELRNDSSLCEEYIEGERDDLEFIVDTMEDMGFLHKYTQYPEIMGNLVSSRTRYDRDMPLSPSIHECSCRAQFQALDAYLRLHGRHPQCVARMGTRLVASWQQKDLQRRKGLHWKAGRADRDREVSMALQKKPEGWARWRRADRKRWNRKERKRIEKNFAGENREDWEVREPSEVGGDTPEDQNCHARVE